LLRPAARNASVRNGEERVTGANRGLGFATARQLLTEGLSVVFAGRDVAALERAHRTLSKPDQRRAVTVQMDVTSVEGITAAQRAVTEQVGPVDVLVNNAAVLLGENDDVLSIPAHEYRRTFETNLFGVIEVSRAFVPGMARGGYGRIVNVSSGAGQLATMSAYALAYSISKAAVSAFRRIISHTYRADGVLVNAVDPGWVRTDMGGRQIHHACEPERFEVGPPVESLPGFLENARRGRCRHRRPEHPPHSSVGRPCGPGRTGGPVPSPRARRSAHQRLRSVVARSDDLGGRLVRGWSSRSR
jgi:NAD(P)-dependent dehydrogenase (short-subunit alcohol dehydrogenase family)